VLSLNVLIVWPKKNSHGPCLFGSGLVAYEAGLVDAGMIFGIGFAPFHSGPIHYLEDRGISEIRQELEQHEKLYGKRFAPDTAWNDLHTFL